MHTELQLPHTYTGTTLPDPKQRVLVRTSVGTHPQTHTVPTSSSYTEQTGNLTQTKKEKRAAEHYRESKGNLTPRKKGKHTPSYTEQSETVTKQSNRQGREVNLNPEYSPT